jgi:hypothetical protein
MVSRPTPRSGKRNGLCLRSKDAGEGLSVKGPGVKSSTENRRESSQRA